MATQQKPQNDPIYSEIFRAILEQRLAPGAKLTESTMADVFGVSRTIIRQVLLRLSLDNVVEIHPTRGAFIAMPKAEDVRQVFSARHLLEDGIVAASAANCSAVDADVLRKIVGKENDCIRNSGRIGAIRLSGEFHLELARIGGNKPLMRLLRQLVAQTSLAIALYETPGNLVCVDDDHINIVEAIAAGDIEKSRALMREHLRQCESHLNLDPLNDSNNLRAVFANVFEARHSA